MTGNIDKLRRDMIEKGVPAEVAGIATGLAAEYAMAAYKQGYSNGFQEGVDYEKEQSDRARERVGL